VTDVGCAIRVFRRECVLQIPVFRGMHRFLPTLVKMQGFRITEQPVDHRPRERGVTKYGIGNRLWVGIGDTLAVRWMQRRMVWDLSTTDGNQEGK
jgi:dolichol-phosphate mannosyltransferase